MHKNTPLKSNGFTLIEIIIVVIIISVMASLALVNYSRTIEMQRCERLRMDLTAIQSSMTAYCRRHGDCHFPGQGISFSETNIDTINGLLGLSIANDPNFTYSLETTQDHAIYDAKATSISGGYRIELDEATGTFHCDSGVCPCL